MGVVALILGAIVVLSWLGGPEEHEQTDPGESFWTAVGYVMLAVAAAVVLALLK